MSPLSPPRSLDPFQRLQVSDGLLITADRWQQAHSYHRQRQNVYYQALHQGGIVWGLGVAIIAPPTDVANEYRDRRWLCIQPGLAIDGQGNPIIVPEPMSFRIASVPPQQGTQSIYLSIRYVDPEQLQGQRDREWVTETFRIEETATLPEDPQIELCRILLQPGVVQLQSTSNVLAPGSNQLDLRYRPVAQTRAALDIQVAVSPTGLSSVELNTMGNRFTSLFRACPGLYPAMEGVDLNALTLTPESLLSVQPDLLYFTYTQFLSLTPTDRTVLQQYLETGALLIVEQSAQDAGIADFCQVRSQLVTALANLSHKIEFADMRRELETEQNALTTLIEGQILQQCAPLQTLTEQMGWPREDPIPLAHPLRNQPFLFSQFPAIEGCPIYLKLWGGIVFVVGPLSSVWNVEETMNLPRETLRATQELGINLLSFAWRRHRLMQLQQGN